ncbi:hypothetical protein CPB83DRAFT_855320 [Crepidotus variabilis]|uniref:NAD-dependent epimerase/dehydratase domain-containing protein n=1 Tax=Crepidotus variabilis TaxID=179855 RepID=A0A9P6EFB1_9AGAR|nr:hypothetical protein CPB83DRAFT_855320 [Crepidotus variabilis]
MPVAHSGSKVLVSGANGYIAMWVVRTLLEQGYQVRGTVRSKDKGEFLKQYFSQIGLADKFEFVIVEDIIKEGAFDEAVKGVDAVEHVASPFTYDIKASDDLLGPAVQGTVGILRSAIKTGTQIKRIVITSSCAAVLNPTTIPTKFSEKDWNTTAEEEFKRLGEKTPVMSLYRLSKTRAERAAWDFYNEHKSKLTWDLVIINPPFVFGPPIHNIKSPKSLNLSLQFWFDAVFLAENYKTKEVLSVSNSWVDVRDTALGHVLALQKEEAGGERIITCGGGFIWQEWIQAANALPENPLKANYPDFQRGFPEILEANPQRIVTISYDISKEQRLFGMKYKTQAETTKDTLEEFAKRGW